MIAGTAGLVDRTGREKLSAATSGRAAKSAPRAGEPPAPAIHAFRGRHLDLAERQIEAELGRSNVTVDESESPLAWLARWRGRNGCAFIEPHQFQLASGCAPISPALI